MPQVFRTVDGAQLVVTSFGVARRVYRNRFVPLLSVALIPLAISGCGGSEPAASPSGVIVVPAPDAPVKPTPAPTPTPTPMPTPTPTPAPTVQALSCTVADAVKRAEPLTIRPVAGSAGIVAIGSSSTAGYFASSSAATYPSILQAVLNQREDLATYVVYNKGLNGDNLVGTEARIERDVISLHPQLVILQIGTNDAINGPAAADTLAFTNRLSSLVARLKSVSAVVLMNGQYYPTQPSNYDDYQKAIDQVSIGQSVPVIDRYALMKSWISSGKYTFSQILANDQFHPNDFTYRCMGQIAAELVTKSTVK